MGEPEFDYTRTIANGFDRCVWCGIVFGAEDRARNRRGEDGTPGIGGGINFTYGPVYDTAGREYDHVGASEGGTNLMHADCYTEYHAEQAAEQNRSLAEFTGTDGPTPSE